ncbi:hypothetical protein HZA39_02030 [Candidatus Peregrinibacteria bacterium]|nr:hypothetical protein [Candidatus Peregrinibacteria bacterium]
MGTSLTLREVFAEELKEHPSIESTVMREVIAILNEPMNQGLMSFPGENPLSLSDLGREVAKENVERIREIVRKTITDVTNRVYPCP